MGRTPTAEEEKAFKIVVASVHVQDAAAALREFSFQVQDELCAGHNRNHGKWAGMLLDDLEEGARELRAVLAPKAAAA